MVKTEVGKTFGRLFALAKDFSALKGDGVAQRFWCECKCGEFLSVAGNNLRKNTVLSCGCFRREVKTKHGHTPTNKPASRTYNSWANMLQRCTNKKRPDFADYGGRGILVCDDWLTFKHFLNDMGERPLGTSIDRKDNDKGYCKDNCKWSSDFEQARNRREPRRIC